MRLALALNDLGSLDRNRGLDPAHRLPRSRTLSPAEAVRLFPHFPSRGLTGAAMWHDARIRSPERLTLAFIRSAAERGAAAANYVAAERFLVTTGEVRGIEASDRRSGRSLEIRARAVVVAAGAWTDRLVAQAAGRTVARRPAHATHAFALNLMVGRRLASVAVGVRASSGPADDPVIGGHRYIFLAPQEEATLLGTWYALDDGTDPNEAAARGAEALRAEFNAACPGLGLTPADVSRAQFGWMPLKGGVEPGRATALADRPRIRDHASEGLRHLFSVEGVKYTTAREVAQDAVDRVVRHLQATAAPCRTGVTPLAGAHYVPADDPRLESRLRSAVRDEMALTLADVVFRRTALAEPPGPFREAVTDAARVVGEELGWDASTRLAEIDEVMRQAEGPTAAPRMVTA
jgi:glycerol-3-phosphate dehydrogenase